jgi:hypothetical protein
MSGMSPEVARVFAEMRKIAETIRPPGRPGNPHRQGGYHTPGCAKHQHKAEYQEPLVEWPWHAHTEIYRQPKKSKRTDIVREDGRTVAIYKDPDGTISVLDFDMAEALEESANINRS